MIMKRFLTLSLACAVALATWAVQVNTTAGNLSQVVTDNSINQLSITGTIDARDFKFMASELSNLVSLNLTNAEIVAYNDKQSPLFFNVTNYEAGTIPAGAFMGKKLRNVLLPSSLKSIELAAFAGCGDLEAITFPQSLDTIGAYAFSACNKLRTIAIPQNLKYLGDGAFSRCDGLKSATIKPAIDFAVGKDAFQDCKSLSSLTLGQNVTQIKAGAFAGCTSLSAPVIEQSSKLGSIAEAAFAGSGLETIALDQCNNLVSVGMWAFANTPLKNVALPQSLESLGDGAFYYNLDMETIDLPAGINSLSDYLLAGNNNVITDQPVKNGVTSIGDYAFYNWDEIQEFIFPSSVQHIGTKAMAGQVNLNQVVAEPTTVPELGDEVWAGVPQHRIPLKVDASVKDDYRSAEQWMEFKIEDIPTTINDNVADATSSVRAHFSGTVLVVNATAAIAKISVFDTRGVLLSATTPATEQAQVETANFTGKFYIVNVILSDGTKHTFKLVR